MNTIRSGVNPAYSVAVFPEKEYGGGNGYFFYLTADGPKGGKAIPACDLPKEVKEEMVPVARYETWGIES